MLAHLLAAAEVEARKRRRFMVLKMLGKDRQGRGRSWMASRCTMPSAFAASMSAARKGEFATIGRPSLKQGVNKRRCGGAATADIPRPGHRRDF